MFGLCAAEREPAGTHPPECASDPAPFGLHALWRAVALTLLGVFLYSLGSQRTNWVFPNVLAQIGLGYFFAYLLLPLRSWVQILALAVILGGYWGLFDAYRREMKYPPGVAISNAPSWKLQMAAGMALSAMTFLAALLTLRRRPWTPRFETWIAVAISATTAGSLLGLAADKMYFESYHIVSWLQWGALLAAAIASPLLCANALMAGRPLPTFLDWLGPRETRSKSTLTILLGLALAVTALVSAETALGFTFAPRYRDFPYASLTMAVVPFASLMLLNRPPAGARPIAEAVFAGLIGVCAVYIAINEGKDNWQSIWTCVMYVLFAHTLWQARAAQSRG